MAGRPARTQLWFCLSCRAANSGVFTPDFCPVCGSYRGSDIGDLARVSQAEYSFDKDSFNEDLLDRSARAASNVDSGEFDANHFKETLNQVVDCGDASKGHTSHESERLVQYVSDAWQCQEPSCMATYTDLTLDSCPACGRLRTSVGSSPKRNEEALDDTGHQQPEASANERHVFTSQMDVLTLSEPQQSPDGDYQIQRNDDPDKASDCCSDHLNSSIRDEIWSDVSSIYSGTSLGDLASYGGHDFVLQAYIELLVNDPAVYELLDEAARREIPIESDRLASGLRRLLKQLGAELKEESVTPEQRRMAKFIALKSRTAVLGILQKIDGSETITRSSNRILEEGLEDSSEEDTDVAEIDSSDEENEENNDLSRAKTFVVESKAFHNMRQNLYDLVHPTMSSKLMEYANGNRKRMKDDTHESWVTQYRVLAMELRGVDPVSIHVQDEIELSILDKLKVQVEGLTGQTWNWWPLRLPVQPLKHGSANLQWTCQCGDIRSKHISLALAKRVSKWIQQLTAIAKPSLKHDVLPQQSPTHIQQDKSSDTRTENLQYQVVSERQKDMAVPSARLISKGRQFNAGFWHGGEKLAQALENAARTTKNTLQGTPVTKSQEQQGTTKSGPSQGSSVRSGSSQGGSSKSRASQRATTQATTTSAQSVSSSQPMVAQSNMINQNIVGWVLLMVQSRNDYYVSQINMDGCTTNTFFTQLRLEYLRLRGLVARCFSVWCYSHCDFYKFHMWDQGAAVPLKRNQYPEASDPEYEYKPKPILDLPSITRHEFKKRYEGCSRNPFHFRCHKQCHCAKAKAKAHNREIIDLLPKKLIQLDVNVDQRTFFWGLYARQEISFFRIIIYNALCISPFIWFFFMWLFAWGHGGDQQNASVPLMAMLSLLSIFWTTFIASLWQKSDGDTV